MAQFKFDQFTLSIPERSQCVIVQVNVWRKFKSWWVSFIFLNCSRSPSSRLLSLLPRAFCNTPGYCVCVIYEWTIKARLQTQTWIIKKYVWWLFLYAYGRAGLWLLGIIVPMLGLLLWDGIVVLKMIMVPTYLPYKIIYLIYHILLLQTIHSHASSSSYPQKRRFRVSKAVLPKALLKILWHSENKLNDLPAP